MASLKTVLEKRPLEEATLQEMIDFADLENLEVSAKARRTKAALAEEIRLAGFGPEITVMRADALLQQTAPGQMSTALDQWDGADETERWVMFQLMADGTDTSPVAAGVGMDRVILRRGVVVVCRERFFERIRDAKDRHRAQKIDEAGKPTQKFAEVPVMTVQRYPYTYLGVVGYVKDGPPDQQRLPAGTEVYVGTTSAPQMAAAA